MNLARRILRFAVLATLVAAPNPGLAFVEMELDVDRMAESIVIDTRIFAAPGATIELDATVPVSGNCVTDPTEGCVGGPGIRRLLRFDVLVHNRGDEDLVLGDPSALPDLFHFSACHGHYHFAQASLYELIDASGTSVAYGRKQGFCLEDTLPSSSSTTSNPFYTCDFQGVQVGWADWYPRELDCQWIDVTDLPPGDYTLHVLWNPEGLLSDSDPNNNEATLAVTIPAPESAPPVVERVLRPNAGAIFATGRVMLIEWSARDDVEIATQEVWFSADGGETYAQIVGDLSGKARSFAWTIPDGTGPGEGRIKIVSRDTEAQKGEHTSESFRITGRGRRVAVR